MVVVSRMGGEEQKETPMIRIAAFAAALALTPLAAHAQPISASRLYKMCVMEDPDCAPTMVAVYNITAAKIRCPPNTKIPTEELFVWRYLTQAPYVLGPDQRQLTALEFARSVALCQ